MSFFLTSAPAWPCGHLTLPPLLSGLSLYPPHTQQLKETLTQSLELMKLRQMLRPLPGNAPVDQGPIYRNTGVFFLKKQVFQLGWPALIWSFFESRKSRCWFRETQHNRTSSRVQVWAAFAPWDRYYGNGCISRVTFREVAAGAGGGGLAKLHPFQSYSVLTSCHVSCISQTQIPVL